MPKSSSSGKMGAARFDADQTLNSGTFSPASKAGAASKSAKPKESVKFSKREALRSERSKRNQKADKCEQLDLMENWFECWQTSNVFVALGYGYYPCPIVNWANGRLASVRHFTGGEFRVGEIDERQDLIDLQIEIGPSVILLYGTFLRDLWFIKETILSWDQLYSDMNSDLLGN